MKLPRKRSFSRFQDWSFIVLCLSLSGLWYIAECSTNSDDVNALLALKQAWGKNAVSALQWTGHDPCGSKWIGIVCDSSSLQRVTSIVLPGLGLNGELAADISGLAALETLDLSFNSLTGPLPRQIGQLTHLSYLVLQFNNFSGTIPSEFGQLKNLSFLYLNGNTLSGGIPNELGLLKNLYWLDVANNKLTGPLPFSSDGNSAVHVGLDNLTNAKHFHLNNNNFSGSIPRPMCHSGMTLIHLLLESNDLRGDIPGELGSCGDLQILKLNDNKLRGTIPDQIAQLTNLTELQLSENRLIGPLPDLSNLTSLGVLELGNNLFEVDFPSWLQSSLHALTDVGMQNMSVMGQIPAAFFELPLLTTVKLANNSINGTLDISKAGGQLLLVSLENNKIESLTPGSYNKDLRLQGNPVCTNTNTFSPKVCSDNAPSPPPPPTSGESNSCSNTCPSGYQVNPLQCTCAIPYQGLLTYRAPAFTTLSNASRIPALISQLAMVLDVDQRQVEIPSAYFNAQNQLLVTISIFPNGTLLRWSRDDVIRMAKLLGRGNVDPPGFGPPMFDQSSSYPYDLGASTAGTGLSTVAKIGIGVGASVLVLIILAVGGFAYGQKWRADKAVELSKPFASWGASGGDSGGAPQLEGARSFSYAELKKATNNFSESNEVGSGSYGKVYRGIIMSGQQVAIKRAQGNSMQGTAEFKNEIELLSRVHHKNVVSLVGFCFEQGEQMLVYEYMANGSLRDSLTAAAGRGGLKLDWRRRLMVALSTARGITYLHELVNPPIIHRDIKSTNILLDEKKVAKVADFGLSKIGPGEGSGKQHVSTQVKGTLGYLDPEYYFSQQLTEKSDVYSYGVVLFELLTARAPIDHGKYVVREVKEAIDKGGLRALRSMMDPRLREEAMAELNAFVRIALSCVEESASNRPTMGQVLKELEELVGHDYPESGSSNIEATRGQLPLHPYGSDSDFMHTSGDSTDPAAFLNSASNIPPSFGST